MVTSRRQARVPGVEGRKANLRLLKWSTIVLPVLFLAIADLLRHTVLWPPLHTLPGFVLTHAALAAAIVFFSFTIFGLIDRLERKVVDQNRQLSALNGIVATAAEKLYLDDLLGDALRRVLDVMQADAGLICLVDNEKEEHSVVCHQGLSAATVQNIRRIKLEQAPMAREVVRTGRATIWERAFDDPRVVETARREGIRSGISAPLKSEGEVNGILLVATRTERHFSDDDQEFLRGIGGPLGMAIRNTVLYERSQLQNRELSALLAVGKAVTSPFDLEEVLRRSLDTIIEVTSADAAEIWLAQDDEHLVLGCHRGAYREAFLERTSFRVGEGLPGIVAQRREPLVVHDIPADARFLRERVTQAGFHTFCALPLQYQSRVVGVLAVGALSAEAVSEPRELRLLEGIGEWVALAIANARLHQQVQELAVVEERERIAREMHDGLAQVLGYVNTKTLAVARLLEVGRLVEAQEQLGQLEAAAKEVYADIREGILGLRTSLGPQRGLLVALREYIQAFEQQSGVPVALEAPEDDPGFALPAGAEVQVLRIIQEALTNVRKHARASRAVVRLQRADGTLQLTVEDDGQGFDPARVGHEGWPRFGLQTMRERAEAVGGKFAVESGPGSGTRMRVAVPLPPPEERAGGLVSGADARAAR